jgi:thiol-disulfide isomerase/thioredoxin
MASRWIRPFALASILALTLAACGGGGDASSSDDDGSSGDVVADAPATTSDASATQQTTAPEDTDVAEEAPEAPAGPSFVAATLDGGELASSSFQGKPTVLWFWAPWCTTCRAEAPDVTATAAAFDGEVEIIGVAGRGEVSEMEDFVADTETGSLTHVVDEDGAIWTDYEVLAQPAFAFIAADGSVETHIGALGEDELTERIEQLTGS